MAEFDLWMYNNRETLIFAAAGNSGSSGTYTVYSPGKKATTSSCSAYRRATWETAHTISRC